MLKILHERVSDRSNEYEEYLNQHILGVKRSYDMIKDIILTESDLDADDITKLELQIEKHDASKYEDEEWYPYLHHFYPSNTGKDNEDAYDKAWNHHQKCNPHHWQYWILQKDSGEQKILDMPENYVIEMLCDWSSFKYKNPESTANRWYNDNKDKMLLSDNTKKIIEKYLSLAPEL